MLTSTCSYYKSCWMICPCGCTAAQRAGVNVNNHKLVHPYWILWHHPLWSESLKSVGLSDYPDPPLGKSVPTFATEQLGFVKDAVLRATTQVFDDLGNMDHFDTSSRIIHFRQYSSKLETFAGASSRGFKIAAAEMNSLGNCLNNNKLTHTLACVRPTVVPWTSGRVLSWKISVRFAVVYGSLW